MTDGTFMPRTTAKILAMANTRIGDHNPELLERARVTMNSSPEPRSFIQGYDSMLAIAEKERLGIMFNRSVTLSLASRWDVVNKLTAEFLEELISLNDQLSDEATKQARNLLSLILTRTQRLNITSRIEQMGGLLMHITFYRTVIQAKVEELSESNDFLTHCAELMNFTHPSRIMDRYDSLQYTLSEIAEEGDQRHGLLVKLQDHMSELMEESLEESMRLYGRMAKLQGRLGELKREIAELEMYIEEQISQKIESEINIKRIKDSINNCYTLFMHYKGLEPRKHQPIQQMEELGVRLTVTLSAIEMVNEGRRSQFVKGDKGHKSSTASDDKPPIVHDPQSSRAPTAQVSFNPERPNQDPILSHDVSRTASKLANWSSSNLAGHRPEWPGSEVADFTSRLGGRLVQANRSCNRLDGPGEFCGAVVAIGRGSMDEKRKRRESLRSLTKPEGTRESGDRKYGSQTSIQNNIPFGRRVNGSVSSRRADSVDRFEFKKVSREFQASDNTVTRGPVRRSVSLGRQIRQIAKDSTPRDVCGASSAGSCVLPSLSESSPTASLASRKPHRVMGSLPTNSILVLDGARLPALPGGLQRNRILRASMSTPQLIPTLHRNLPTAVVAGESLGPQNKNAMGSRARVAGSRSRIHPGAASSLQSQSNEAVLARIASRLSDRVRSRINDPRRLWYPSPGCGRNVGSNDDVIEEECCHDEEQIDFSETKKEKDSSTYALKSSTAAPNRREYPLSSSTPKENITKNEAQQGCGQEQGKTKMEGVAPTTKQHNDTRFLAKSKSQNTEAVADTSGTQLERVPKVKKTTEAQPKKEPSKNLKTVTSGSLKSAASRGYNSHQPSLRRSSLLKQSVPAPSRIKSLTINTSTTPKGITSTHHLPKTASSARLKLVKSLCARRDLRDNFLAKLAAVNLGSRWPRSDGEEQQRER